MRTAKLSKQVIIFTAIFMFFAVSEREAQEKTFKDHIYYELRNQASESQTIENVSLDNHFIQSYNHQVGLWHFIGSRAEGKNIARAHGVDIGQIEKSNGIPMGQRLRGWFFVPYSQMRYKQLLADGVSRQKWQALKGEFIWPVLGSRITSRVGKRWGIHHNGLDIATGPGNIVLSAQEGVVIKTHTHGGYGMMVSIRHPQGYITRYAHLSAHLVRKGDRVRKGQIIALSGNSGRSTGPHLHFEVECEGIILDPENFLPQFQASMESLHSFHIKIFDGLKMEN